jgi:hypothetical protein
VAVSWEDFLREVLPDVAGCPVQIAENAIRNAAIEFCNETRVWRERIVDIPLVQGTVLYTLDTTGAKAAADVLAVHKVTLNDSTRPLSTIPKQHLDQQYLVEDEQRPWYYNNDEPSKIRFYPAPDTAYTGEVHAALKPTRTATEGPDFLFTDWLECIASGAKSKLMAMAGRPWSDPKMVRYHRDIFVRGYVEARIRDVKSNVQSSSFMMPARKFGRYTNSRWYR